jgi:hypothetical protein
MMRTPSLPTRDVVGLVAFLCLATALLCLGAAP